MLGFKQFSLRGVQKVTLEWDLVCVAYNLKRLHKLKSLLKHKAKAPHPAKSTPLPFIGQLEASLGPALLGF